MSRRTGFLGLIVVAALGLTAYLLWSSMSAPDLPEIPLAGADPKLVEAVEVARREVRNQPRSGEAWGQLGMVLAANGFTESSLPCFEHASRFDPENARWPLYESIQLGRMGRIRDGLPQLRRAVNLARTREERSALLYTTALILLDEGELDEADEFIQKLAGLDSNGPRSRFLQAVSAKSRGDLAAAREHLAGLMDDPHTRKIASTLMAQVLVNEPEEAKKYRDQAERFPPDLPWLNPLLNDLGRYSVTLSNRMDVYRQMEAEGRQQEAIDYLRGIVADSPDPEALSTLGVALFRTGDFKGCTEALQAALSIDSKHVKSLVYLGSAYLELGQRQAREKKEADAKTSYQNAVSSEDRALVIQASNTQAHLVRGRALKRLGRTEEALGAFRNAVLSQPENPETHLELGTALAESGRVKDAIEHLENAVKMARPDDPRPKEALDLWKPKAK
jgi:tetratricopeptide (TPR) repeat protein